MTRPTREDLKKLSIEERLLLLEDVWASLDEDHPHPMPIPKWHEEELDHRLRDLERNGSDGIEWSEFYQKLRKKYR